MAVPTIGISGSPACDGQILVIDDMLGLFTEFTPKFVKRYRRLGEQIRTAARDMPRRCAGAVSLRPSTPIRGRRDTRIASVKPTPQMARRR